MMVVDQFYHLPSHLPPHISYHHLTTYHLIYHLIISIKIGLARIAENDKEEKKISNEEKLNYDKYGKRQMINIFC